jgi:Uma2 family endonuclease
VVNKAVSSTTVPSISQPPDAAPYHWTVEKFYRAIDAGVFDHPERLELIKGELIEKMGQNPAHASLISRLTRRLRSRLEPKFTVREEKPIHLGDDAEPLPDIMVVSGTEADYEQRHPTAADVVLLVEVAASSAAHDTRDKAILYAQSGVAEYWVLSVIGRELIIYRKPTPDGYAFMDRSAGDDLASLSSAPEIAFSVGELFES